MGSIRKRLRPSKLPVEQHATAGQEAAKVQAERATPPAETERKADDAATPTHEETTEG